MSTSTRARSANSTGRWTALAVGRHATVSRPTTWSSRRPSRTRARSSPRCRLWWFDQLADIVAEPCDLSTAVPDAGARPGYALSTPWRCYPVECVARGYLTGSGLADYRATGSVCGIDLPAGAVDGSRAARAHLHPRDQGRARRPRREHRLRHRRRRRSGATQLRTARLSLAVYARAEDRPGAGHLLADTKFEFGRRRGKPGGAGSCSPMRSSPRIVRFWPPTTGTRAGQASFDKQYVRDWLASPESGGTGTPVAPAAATRRGRRERPEPDTSRPTSA